ncbi:hypothetical protein HYD86_00715 [Mycoplasmopsis bovis]|nr:hypothetical protein [Mycoplasmopsis bovis]QQH36801.1 hypothetical protein HYD86_00715 [Mycoplasmopsis bovis]
MEIKTKCNRYENDKQDKKGNKRNQINQKAKEEANQKKTNNEIHNH